MAVLVEGISVVIRREAINARYPGGWERFVADAPNRTLCADPHLARVGFMVPDDVKGFIETLGRNAIAHHTANSSGDAVVVDQMSGPTSRCDWVEVGSVGIHGGKVAVARLSGDQTNTVATPDGWKYEGSLSEKFTFVPTKGVPQALKFLRRENGVDVYLDLQTGREVYQGRTSER